MHTPPVPNQAPSQSVRLPHWMALLCWPVLFLLVHVALPWALSLLSPHHGWTHGRPRRRHLLALLLVAAGTAGLSWCARLHFTASADSFELQPTPRFLLMGGPYTFTRNPMYLCALAIWLGWALFYGSIAILVGVVVGSMIVTLLVVPWEERELEARFGEAYVRYKNRVPCWFGKRHR